MQKLGYMVSSFWVLFCLGVLQLTDRFVMGSDLVQYETCPRDVLGGLTQPFPIIEDPIIMVKLPRKGP